MSVFWIASISVIQVSNFEMIKFHILPVNYCKFGRGPKKGGGETREGRYFNKKVLNGS